MDWSGLGGVRYSVTHRYFRVDWHILDHEGKKLMDQNGKGGGKNLIIDAGGESANTLVKVDLTGGPDRNVLYGTILPPKRREFHAGK